MNLQIGEITINKKQHTTLNNIEVVGKKIELRFNNEYNLKN